MKILVADDSRTTLIMLTESLKRLGHEVIPVMNGLQAINVFQKQRPDLIILDVVMEGMNGFECAKSIRALNTDDWIPIIFLSGTVDDENVSKGINSGGDDYLTKPYSEIILAAKIKAMQRISDMRQKLFNTTKQLADLSATDALTGIANRLQFDNTIKEKVSHTNRYGRMMALLFIDLDKFKAVNDSLGHHIGDLLLKEVSKRLKACIRLDDFIARIGGDEFAIILNGIENKEVAGEIAKKLIKISAPTYNLEGNEISIGCSIGIACFMPNDPISVETLVQNADIAMYHSKETGRNNFQYFDSELYKKYHEKINLETALKVAVDKNQFSVLYQPVFNLKTKEIVRIESLASWMHPQFGQISASVFIPLAERLGLIDYIGLWVIEATCKQGEKWFAAGLKNCKLSINMSPRELMQKNLLQYITNILQNTHIAPEQLEFELTETSPLIYSDLYKNALANIHEIGVSICLDDFGKTYSSLSHLQKLPINGIKIDRTFIANIASNVSDAMLVKSIIMLSHNLGFDVIAEGVETKEQFDFLVKNGCKLGQGYYFCRPLSAEDMTQYIAEQQPKILV